ncbi:hypothetical protein [Streptomyces olivaceoviridis]|uniref:hypothetical protein n=1 Tax=Streptomyces olivaceoviridis TaxID=1921 RepID=UPI003697C421
MVEMVEMVAVRPGVEQQFQQFGRQAPPLRVFDYQGRVHGTAGSQGHDDVGRVLGVEGTLEAFLGNAQEAGGHLVLGQEGPHGHGGVVAGEGAGADLHPQVVVEQRIETRPGERHEEVPRLAPEDGDIHGPRTEGVDHRAHGPPQRRLVRYDEVQVVHGARQVGGVPDGQRRSLDGACAQRPAAAQDLGVEVEAQSHPAQFVG